MLGTLTHAGALHAQAPPGEPPDVEALVSRGLEFGRQHRDDDALEQFRAAYDAAPGPRPAGLMGMVEETLQRWMPAEQHLTEALGAAEDPWVRRSRALLEESLARVRRHLGWVTVVGGVPGAEVTLNGESAGTMPLEAPLRAAVGSASLVVRARGFVPVSRVVEVVPGGVASETVNMVPVQTAGAASTTATTATTGDAPPPPRPELRCAPGLELRAGMCFAPPRVPSYAGALRAGFWIGAGVATTAALAATALWFDGSATADSYRARCGGAVAPAECEGQYTTLREDLSARALVVNLLLVTTVLGAAGAVVSLAVGTRAGVRIAAAPSGLTLAW